MHVKVRVRVHSLFLTYSLSSGLNLEGGPTMDTIDDGAITRFYESKTPEGEEWDRTFSMVVAQNPSETCGVYNATEDVFLSNSFKGQAVNFWAILNRQVRGSVLYFSCYSGHWSMFSSAEGYLWRASM